MTSSYGNYMSSSYMNYNINNNSNNNQVNGYLNYYHNYLTEDQQASPRNHYSNEQQQAQQSAGYDANNFFPSAPMKDQQAQVSSSTCAQSSHYHHHNIEHSNSGNNQHYFHHNNKSKAFYWNQLYTDMAMVTNYQMQQQYQANNYQQQQSYQAHAESLVKDSNYLSDDNSVQSNSLIKANQFTAESNQNLNDAKLLPESSGFQKILNINGCIDNEKDKRPKRLLDDNDYLNTDHVQDNQKDDSPALRALLTNPRKKLMYEPNYIQNGYLTNNDQKSLDTCQMLNNFDRLSSLNLHNDSVADTPPISPESFVGNAESPEVPDWALTNAGTFIFEFILFFLIFNMTKHIS